MVCLRVIPRGKLRNADHAAILGEAPHGAALSAVDHARAPGDGFNVLCGRGDGAGERRHGETGERKRSAHEVPPGDVGIQHVGSFETDDLCGRSQMRPLFKPEDLWVGSGPA